LRCLTQLTRLTFAGHLLSGQWQRPETPVQKRCATLTVTLTPTLTLTLTAVTVELT